MKNMKCEMIDPSDIFCIYLDIMREIQNQVNTSA